MYLGNNSISEIYLAQVPICELYLGDTLIYKTNKGIITDGLRYYLDGRDFISGSNEWLPQVSKNPQDELVTISGHPAKIGNCVKLAGGAVGQSLFKPNIPATTFTFECYIKDIGQINDVSLWRFLGPTYSYGVYCTMNTYGYEPEMWIDGLTSSGYSFECILDPHNFKSLYVQITCLNGNANVYVNGELIRTGSNFGLYEEEPSLVLGDVIQSIGEPTFSSIRYYERALTKDELDTNRQFDLSIY